MQHKSLSQALERVNAIYLPGTIEFYDKISPNPWQKAHDELEESIVKISGSNDYFENLVPHLNAFVTKIEELISNYRPFAPGKKMTPQEIGLYSNSEDEAMERYSLQEKSCAKCGTKSDIRVVKSPRTGNPGIMCRACLPDQKKSARP